jgi:hypothetical protein
MRFVLCAVYVYSLQSLQVEGMFVYGDGEACLGVSLCFFAESK